MVLSGQPKLKVVRIYINAFSIKNMRLCLLLACICRLVLSDMCIVCQPGKYNTFSSNLPCALCEANTYAPNAGMSTCMQCGVNSTSGNGSASCTCLPGMTRLIGSTACVEPCVGGLVRSTEGGCLPISNNVVVLSLEMTLMLPQNATSTEVEKAISIVLSQQYEIPLENMVVKIVPLSSTLRRMLLQTTSALRYTVEVYIFFANDVSAADIAATKKKLGATNGTEIGAALEAAPTGLKLRVLDTGTVYVKQESSTGSTPSPSVAPSTPTTPAPIAAPSSEAADLVTILVASGAVLIVLAVGIGCTVVHNSQHNVVQ